MTPTTLQPSQPPLPQHSLLFISVSVTYSQTQLQARLAAIVNFYFTELFKDLRSRMEKVGETKEREEAESSKMKNFQDNGQHMKRAFNQYFNGKPSCADCKNGFGAHSLKVNTLATGLNWPIHQV